MAYNPKDDKGLEFTKGATQYTFNTKELAEQRNLINEITLDVDAMNDGLYDVNKSLTKQNENFASILEEKRKIAGTDKLSYSQYQAMVKAVISVKDGSKDINDLMKERAKAQKEGNKDAADIFDKEIKRQNVQTAVNDGIKQADDLTGGLVNQAQGALKTFKQMGPAMGGITLGIAAAIALLLTFNEQQEAIADQFGAIGANELNSFNNRLAVANQEFIAIGLKGADAQRTISTLANDFGVAYSEADKMAVSVGELSVATGLSLDSTTKLLGTLKKTQGLTADQASDLIKSTQALAVANDVAPDQVLEDVAGNTEQFARFAKDGGENVLRAAIQARKLGLSLDSVAKTAEGLLNFQDSLNKEIEASIMIGRNVNLQKARELALAGDLEGVQSEILKQVGSEAEFNKMNAMQRQALADAVGLQTAELQKLVAGEKEAATLQGEMAKQNISDIVSENAITGAAEMINQLKALGVQLASNVGPALNMVVGIFSGFVGALRELKILTPLIVGLLASVTINLLAQAAASIKSAFATMQLIKAKSLESGLLMKINRFGLKNVAIVKMSNAQQAIKNFLAKDSIKFLTLQNAYSSLRSTILGGEAAALTSSTVAENINTGAKKKGIFATLKGIGTSIAYAAAKFFEGAASMSAATFGFGTVAAIAIAALAVGAMLGAVASAKSAGDINSPAKGKTMVSTKEGGLFKLSKNDDLMAGPGLSGALGGGGGGTDTSRLEGKQNETNSKLERVASVLEGALSGPRPALARAMGSTVGDTVGEMA